MPRDKRPIRRIACVGEVMIELVTREGDAATIGAAGDTYNTAVYLARALRGGDAAISYVTALGQDPYSERILAAMRGHGIDTGHVERREERIPGLYAIDTDAEGERSFTYWRGESAARTLFEPPCTVPVEALDGFDLVLLSGITMAILPPAMRARVIGWAETFCANGGTLAYDSNHRPRLWEAPDAARDINDAMWARADIALPSVDDEMAIHGERSESSVLARLGRLGVRRGALKRGAAGPLDLATATVPANLPKVEEVVDSTAAGDSFNAGFLAAVVSGRSDLDAARAGHLLASRVIRHRGAIIPGEGA